MSTAWSHDNYVNTSPTQRVVLSAFAAAVAMHNPHRGDMVAILGETTGEDALQRMHSELLNSVEGQDILADKPRIHEDHLDFARLRALPATTLGGAYIAFMDRHGYKAKKRTPVRYVEDAELAYVMQRYREVHDIWHVLVDLPTTVLGEIALKWLEMLQTGLPMAMLSALVGPLRLPVAEKLELVRVYIPWAIACHRSINNTSISTRPPAIFNSLLTCYYERRMEEDLDRVRHQLGVLAFPAFEKSLRWTGPLASPFSPLV